MPWIVPAMAFFVLTGLGLDYDLFLCVRITEARVAGFSPVEAVGQGLTSAGGTIASCGIIMVVAFGSLLFSGNITLNVLGFAMVVGVAFDSFVVAGVLNPALMSLIGHMNWWPSPLAKAAHKQFVMASDKKDVGPVEDLGTSLQPSDARLCNPDA